MQSQSHFIREAERLNLRYRLSIIHESFLINESVWVDIFYTDGNEGFSLEARKKEKGRRGMKCHHRRVKGLIAVFNQHFEM